MSALIWKRVKIPVNGNEPVHHGLIGGKSSKLFEYVFNLPDPIAWNLVAWDLLMHAVDGCKIQVGVSSNSINMINQGSSSV